VVRLGFEVRVELTIGEHEAFAQVTRGVVEELGLAPGVRVHVRPVSGAKALAVPA
jgi:sulfate transport system ATP-binding protein